MSDAVDPDRLPYGGSWEGKVGILDVNPSSYTKYSSTLSTSSSATDINNAIAAAAANQYVELAAGTFTLGGEINFNTDNKSLRGQVDANGIPTTRLRFSSSSTHVNFGKTSWDLGSSGGFTTRTVSSGATRGSTTLTLTAAPTGLTSERLLFISAPESGTDIDGGGGWTDFIGTKPWVQIVKVTAVSGNDVTFTPAINASYISALAVEVHYRGASDQINYCGIENCILEVGTSSYFDNHCIEMSGANQCWIRNCQLLRLGGTSSLRALWYVYGGFGCELSHSKIAGFDHATGTISSMYGMSGLDVSSLLVVNNEFTDTANVWPILMTSGSVFAYNYCHTMNYGDFQSQWVFDHGGCDHFNLLEGNWIAGQHIMDEPTNGGNPTYSNNTLICRERIVGYDQAGGATTNLNCLQYIGASKNVTVAACVMGSHPPAIQDGVDGNGGNEGEGQGWIYNTHTSTDSTMDRLGNYNTVTEGIPASEITALNGNEVLTSYIYSSKPSWFGNRPWPWCTPSNYTQSNTVTNLPAGYRSVNGTDPPSDVTNKYKVFNVRTIVNMRKVVFSTILGFLGLILLK
jgi:hypothetical protein